MTQPTPLDSESIRAIQSAVACLRRGDAHGARKIGETALAAGCDPSAISAMLGVVCCQMGDLEAGIGHLRTAHRSNPKDVTVHFNLVSALVQSGQMEDALACCAPADIAHDTSFRLLRMRGYILQQREDYEAAAADYRGLVEAIPDDFEAWNNLGNCYAALGDADRALDALDRATKLMPDVAPVRLNHASALLDAGKVDEAIGALLACTRDFPGDAKPVAELGALYKRLGRDEEALQQLEQAVALEPRDADLRLKLGTELSVALKMDDAEQAYRSAIDIDPSSDVAYVLLANHLEHMNRDQEFAPLIASAREADVDDGAIAFMRALSLRREGRFEEGLATLSSVPETLEPSRSAQLAGQFHDRLGNAADAFDAFTRMNQIMIEDPTQPLVRAAAFRDALAQDRALVSKDWFGRWNAVAPPMKRPSPVFLMGFPRSGTTLLDTMLMGHRDVQVLEERPPITKIHHALGSFEKLEHLTSQEIMEHREAYFAEAAQWIDLRPDSMLVDKNPLHLNKIPLIHRLFPDARLILALRHPCDVILSCFMTNFRPNNAMVNFLQLDTAAEFYNMTFGFFEQCRAIMPLNVHEIIYENVVEDSEATLRPLFDYLGLDWRDEVLDHQQTAAGRGFISTASYSQVHEPLYKRAKGRWTKYRAQLEPVLPVLAPWIQRYGYE